LAKDIPVHNITTPVWPKAFVVKEVTTLINQISEGGELFCIGLEGLGLQVRCSSLSSNQISEGGELFCMDAANILHVRVV
jgi:hypothetical protein